MGAFVFKVKERCLLCEEACCGFGGSLRFSLKAVGALGRCSVIAGSAVLSMPIITGIISGFEMVLLSSMAKV